MNALRRIRRIAAALAGLACACLALALAAPAAFAQALSSPGGGMSAALVREALLHGEDPAPVSGSGSARSFAAPAVTRTVVVGGMSGWQIALIAVGAALLTATLAVLVDGRAGRPGTGRAPHERPGVLTDPMPDQSRIKPVGMAM
jgi:hypothetical protein